MVRTKLCSVDALFLKTEQLLLENDILMAQNLSRLGKQFSDIRHMVEGKGIATNMPCKECSGIKCENFLERERDFGAAPVALCIAGNRTCDAAGV